jgi:hypothetical protein
MQITDTNPAGMHEDQVRRLMSLARVRERLGAAGLVEGRNEMVWELPPDRR